MEVDMLSAKMDLLMKKLKDRANEKQEVIHIHDSHRHVKNVEILGIQGTTILKLKRM